MRSKRSMTLSQFCADVDIWGIIPGAVTQIIVSTFGLCICIFLLEFVIRDEILIMATPISSLVSTFWFVVIVPFHPVWRVVLPSILSQDICALSKYQRSFNSQKNLLDICSLKNYPCRIKKYWTYPPLNTCHSPDGIQEFSGGDDPRILMCFRGIWWWFSKSSKEDDVWVAIGSEGGLFAGKCNKDLGQGESSDDEDENDDDTI